MNNQQSRLLLALANHPSFCTFLLILVLLAGVGATYHQAKRLALERIERVLDGRVSAHKHYLLEALGRYWLIPDVVAMAPQVRQLLTQPSANNIAATNSVLEEMADSIQADRIYVMNLDGTTLAANAGHEKKLIVGENYQSQPYFQQSLAGQTGHFIGIGIASPVTGYIISRPVIIDGKVAGVVALRISLSLQVFQTIVKQYWENNSELAMITDEHGVIFMAPIDDWMYKTFAPLPKILREQIEHSGQYADNKLMPISMAVGDKITDVVRFVRFPDMPEGHTFVQKLYSIGEIGDRIYLHVNASQYWEPVLLYTSLAALVALATLLLIIALFQRWSYGTKLIAAAIQDPLTGLYTRLYMDEWIQNAMRTHVRDEAAGFALVIFDLDRFKKINDTHGHLVGDAVLKGVGRIVLASIRANDLAVRFGGEELAVFVRYTEQQEAITLADRIRKKLEESGVDTKVGRIRVTVSGGLAFHETDETSDSLFARADKKLYEAKESGRNRLCF